MRAVVRSANRARRRFARDTGTTFVLRNPSEFVHRQLRVTGLAEMFGLPAGDPSAASRSAHP